MQQTYNHRKSVKILLQRKAYHNIVKLPMIYERQALLCWLRLPWTLANKATSYTNNPERQLNSINISPVKQKKRSATD